MGQNDPLLQAVIQHNLPTSDLSQVLQNLRSELDPNIIATADQFNNNNNLLEEQFIVSWFETEELPELQYELRERLVGFLQQNGNEEDIYVVEEEIEPFVEEMKGKSIRMRYFQLCLLIYEDNSSRAQILFLFQNIADSSAMKDKLRKLWPSFRSRSLR